MSLKFVNSVKRKVKSLRKDVRFYDTESMAEQLLYSSNTQQELASITDYQIAFHELYRANDKLNADLEKCLSLLNNQSHYRHDISQVAVSTMVRELRLPHDGSSDWQLLYETLLLPMEVSGPILHLHFNDWELVDYDIYYWDEAAQYDPEMA